MREYGLGAYWLGIRTAEEMRTTALGGGVATYTVKRCAVEAAASKGADDGRVAAEGN